MNRVVDWVRRHDAGGVALRRAGRTAVVMPGMLAICVKLLDAPVSAPFAAFGAFCLLLLADFTGTMRARLQAQAALLVSTAGLICLGTVVSRSTWLAVVTMAGVGLVVLFAGVVSSVLASATTSLLLSFILPASLPAPVSQLPDRLEGWALAGGASLLAVWALWPAPARNPLRDTAIRACRAIAGSLRADVEHVMHRDAVDHQARHDAAAAAAHDAVAALQRTFLATPWRPTGLTTSARSVVRLVDELLWLDAVLAQRVPRGWTDAVTGRVRSCAAAVLEQGADLLDHGGEPDGLHRALDELRDGIAAVEQAATDQLPVRQRRVVTAPDVVPDSDRVEEFLTSLDPAFRAQELTFAASQIAANLEAAVAADRRGWLARLAGRRPDVRPRQLATAGERARGHLDLHSVWLHNSVRGAVGLAIAVLVAEQTGVQHSFWVILGTLSVLRSNALNTGQNVMRAMAGTVVGFLIGAGLIELVGTDPTVLWLLLPVAILVAGFAPAAISFAAGQAGFTLALVILFNLLQPTGWRVGLVRIEDIGIGCGVSLVVGALMWPRGAGAALGDALHEAYSDSAAYLRAAVDHAMRRCAGSSSAAATGDATRAAAASRRLDDAFRTYLAERGAKPLPLADVTTLVTGVAALRQVGDAVLDLWQRHDGPTDGDRSAARDELNHRAGEVADWYDGLGAALAGRQQPPDELVEDPSIDRRLLEAVRRDLSAEDGRATATAVRMIWTGEHLDAARLLQSVLVEPGQAATRARAAQPLGVDLHGLLPRRHAGATTP